MAGLLLPRGSWGQQKPSVGTQIDWSHPISRGLIFYALLNDGQDDDLVYGLSPTRNTETWSIGPAGTGLRYAGGVSGTRYGTGLGVRIPTLTAVTLATSAQVTTPTLNRYLGAWRSTGVTNAVSWKTTSSSTIIQRFFVGASSLSDTVALDDRPHIWIGTGSAAGMRLYKDGNLANSNGTSAVVDPTSAAVVAINDSLDDARGAPAIVHWQAIWNRALTAAEARQLQVEPFCMFQPPVWRRYYIVAGGASPTVTPSLLTLTLTLQTRAVSTGSTVAPSLLTLTSTLHAPTVTTVQSPTVSPSLLTLTGSVLAPSVSTTLSPVVSPSLLTLTASTLAPTAGVLQVAMPASDFDADGWITDAGLSTGLATRIDEPTTPDDADYIQGPISPATPYEAKVRLAATGDPLVGTGHVVRYRYRKDAADGDRIDLVVTLYAADGTTEIASQGHIDITATPTDGVLELTVEQADAIPTGDYATGLVLGFAEVLGVGGGALDFSDDINSSLLLLGF